jgi:hypothetical protein
MDCIAIDPGAKMGWALLQQGLVRDCGLINVSDTVPCLGSLHLISRGIVLIEKPVYHHGGRNKVDPNDLITLGIKVGRVMEIYLAMDNVIRLVTPVTWKGSVPNEIQEARTIQALSADELAAVRASLENVPRSYQHNVWDAVGLAIWFAKKECLR